MALVLAGCAVLAVEARHLTFHGDDWQFILGRRGLSAGVFLRPHLQHLSALPILAYKVLLTLFGAHSYAPFIGLLLLVHGIASLLLYAIARRSLGPWAALVPTAVLVVLGPAWADLLWAFQIGYIGSVAAGFGMILFLQRRDRLGDVAAAALLIVSLLCSSVGLGMLLLAAVLIALERLHAWRRLWIVGVPLALYTLWYEAYEVRYGLSDYRSHNIGRIPNYLVQAASAGVASVTGVGQAHGSPYLVSIAYGRFIALVAVGLLVVHLVRGGKVPALTWSALIAAAGLWTAAAVAYFPSREPNQSRYQYVAGALLLLAAATVAPGWRATRRTGTALGAAVLAIVAANVVILHQRARYWREDSAYTAAEAGALEVARPIVAPSFKPIDVFTAAATGHNGLAGVSAGPYFAAVDAFGSSADRPIDILHRSEEVRVAADLILRNAERLGLQPARDPPPRGATCRSAATGANLPEWSVGPGVLWIKEAPGAPAELQVRRFASRSYEMRFGTPPAASFVPEPNIASGRPWSFAVPTDNSSLPWNVRVVGGRRIRLCFARLGATRGPAEPPISDSLSRPRQARGGR